MKMVEVTIGASAAPAFSPAAGAQRVYAAWAQIYNNNATDAIYYGGEGVTSLTGVKLAGATASSPIFRADNRICLNELYVAGTASDTFVVVYEPA